MYFTDNIIPTVKSSVSGEEIIQQPKTLSVWFYASLIFSLSLFETHINKELATSTRRESAK